MDSRYKDRIVGLLVNPKDGVLYDPTTTEGVAIFYKLVAIAQYLGATSRELESMRVRFYDSADIVLGADQEHPALVAQSYQHPVLSTGKVLPMNVRGKRQNMLVGPGRGRRLHPKKMRWWPTSASGAIMAVTRATKRPLEELAEARRALGWGAFSGPEEP